MTGLPAVGFKPQARLITSWSNVLQISVLARTAAQKSSWPIALATLSARLHEIIQVLIL